MAKQLVCCRCGTTGYAKKVTQGSIGTEILLWILFIVPGVLYSAWRMSTKKPACRACGGTELVPLGTPRAQQLMAELGTKSSPPREPVKSSPVANRVALGLVAVVVVLGVVGVIAAVYEGAKEPLPIDLAKRAAELGWECPEVISQEEPAEPFYVITCSNALMLRVYPKRYGPPDMTDDDGRHK